MVLERSKRVEEALWIQGMQICYCTDQISCFVMAPLMWHIIAFKNTSNVLVHQVTTIEWKTLFFFLSLFYWLFTLLATCYCEDMKKGGPDKTLVDPAIFPHTQGKNTLIWVESHSLMNTLTLKMAKYIVNQDECHLMSDNWREKARRAIQLKKWVLIGGNIWCNPCDSL